MKKWRICVKTKTEEIQKEVSKRDEIRDLLETHNGEKYRIYNVATGILYESGIVDATSGEDLEYAH